MKKNLIVLKTKIQFKFIQNITKNKQKMKKKNY